MAEHFPKKGEQQSISGALHPKLKAKPTFSLPGYYSQSLIQLSKLLAIVSEIDTFLKNANSR